MRPSNWKGGNIHARVRPGLPYLELNPSMNELSQPATGESLVYTVEQGNLPQIRALLDRGGVPNALCGEWGVKPPRHNGHTSGGAASG